jgi:serine/threonine protein kinase
MLIRELQAHPNVVRLIDICQNSCAGRLQCSIVMEYMAVDLWRVMEMCRKDGVHLKESVSRTLSVDLLAGLGHIHSHHIVHRDIKPQNLLVSRDLTTLKISDFGSSRRFIPGFKMNSYACTRWYRPPELFLQCSVAYDAVVARRGDPLDMTQVEYMQSTSGCAEDIWSAGCVCMEMARCDVPTFMQNSWKDMLEAITRVIGSPEIEDLREMCRDYQSARKIIPEQVESTLSERIFAFDEDVQCMLVEMLKWNPHKRTSALGAALHLTKGREHNETPRKLEYASI